MLWVLGVGGEVGGVGFVPAGFFWCKYRSKRLFEGVGLWGLVGDGGWGRGRGGGHNG